MASVYDAIEVKGQMRYRRDKRFIGKDKIPPVALEAITLTNIVDENGLIIVDQKGEEEKAPENTNDNQEEKNDEQPDSSTEDSEDSDKSPDPDADSDEKADDEDSATAPDKKVSRAKKPTAREPKFISKVPQSRPGMGFPRRNGKTVDVFDGVTPHTHIKLVGGHTVPLSTENFNTKTEKEIEVRLEEMGFELINYTNRGPAQDGIVEDASEEEEDDGLSDDRP